MTGGFGYDPEVPAGYQDADIEMAELREAAIEAEELTDHRELMRKELTLDDQELTILIQMIQLLQGIELAASMFEPDDRPTTRQISLKSTEMKLIRMRETLNG